MSLTGIDVSSYQGTINWWAVKQNGIDFAILKVIRKDLNPDKKFEENWKGCKEHNVHVHGVYEYGYITTVAKSRSDNTNWNHQYQIPLPVLPTAYC